jgi:plastocyanin
MKRRIAITIIAFIFGFWLRGFLDSQGVYVHLPELVPSAKKTTTAAGVPAGVSDFITEVKYENASFKPASVTIKKGNYLAITNVGDSLMWLSSDNPKLSTPRGYGKSEQLRIKPETIGSHTVTDTLHQGVSLHVSIID